MFADTAESSLPILASLTAVEVLGEDRILTLQMGAFVTIIDVVEVLEAEDVAFKAIVESSLEHLVHKFRVADGVVHEMDLPPQHHKFVEALGTLDNWVIVGDLDDWLFEISFNAFVSSLRNIVTSEVKLLLGFVRNLNTLLRSMIVAIPLSEVIAIVDIGSEDNESLTQRLFALETLGLFLAGSWSRLVVEYL
jgi:hypothetical protein